MNKFTRRVAMAALMTLPLALAAPGAMAQSWPSQPLKLVVPFPPGGGADALARVIADKLKDRVGQPVVVDNRPGGGTVVGSEAVARAAPDGHTLLLNVPTLITAPYMVDKLSFDPLADFIPVIEIIKAQLYVAVSTAKTQATTLRDFLSQAKTPGNEVFFGSVGTGSFGHLMGFRLGEEQGVKLTHVAYRGGAPALAALLAGDIPMTITEFGTLKPHLESGRLRILAATGTTRSPLSPNVPTMGEAGFPGYEAHSWAGIFLPAKTPAAVVQRLADEIAATLRDPEVAGRVANLGYDSGTLRQAAFGDMLRRDQQFWGGLIQKAGVKAN